MQLVPQILGKLPGCVCHVVTQDSVLEGPRLKLMIYDHHFVILNNFLTEELFYYFSLGFTNYIVLCE